MKAIQLYVIINIKLNQKLEERLEMKLEINYVRDQLL